MTKTAHEKMDVRYDACGLDNIILQGMPVVKDDGGDTVYKVPNIRVLHAIIMLGVVTHPGALSGKEVRFIRTELGKTQEELARDLHKDGQSLARWEKGKTTMDPNTEIVLRQIAMDHLIQRGFFEYLKEPRPELTIHNWIEMVNPGLRNAPIRIEPSKRGYKLAA